MQKIKKYIPLGLIFAPALAFAATIPDLIMRVGSILGLLVPLLIGLAVVIFLIGVVRYITAGGDPEKRTEARNVMIYGIIGLFVMVAIWGLVEVLRSTFGLTQTTPPETPTLPQ